MKKTALKDKTLILFICLNFLGGDFSYALPALSVQPAKPAPSLSLEKFSIPENLGSVQELKDSGQDKPVIFYIQDAHGIKDAQTNIQKLILYLQEHHKVSVVGVEGARDEIDPTLLRAFPDEFAKKKVLDSYLKLGEVSGADLAAALNPERGRFYGIEDWPLYQENYAAYAEADRNQKELLEILGKLKIEAEAERRNVYSVELSRFHEKQDAFLDEKLGILELADFLSDLEKMYGENQRKISESKTPHLWKLISAVRADSGEPQDLDTAIRQMSERFKKKLFSRLRLDRQREFNKEYQNYVTGMTDPGAYLKFLMEVGKEVGAKPKLSRGMRELLGQVETFSTIKGTQLFKELEEVLAKWEESLTLTAEEKKIAERFNRLRMLKTIAKLELTREQLETYQKDPEGHLTLLGEKRELLSPALSFYRAAIERDDAFMVKIKRILKKEKVNGMAVLTGGFHAEGMHRHLKSENWSYVIITPKISSLEGHDSYLNAMTGKLSYREYLKKSFYDAFMRHAVFQLVKDYNEPEFKQNVKVWRDRVIKEMAEQGRLAEAGEYTGYIDRLIEVYKEKYGDQIRIEKSREEILSAVESELDRFNAAKVKEVSSKLKTETNWFMSAVNKLQEAGRWNSESFSELLKRIPAGNSGLASLAPMANKRSEERLLGLRNGETPLDVFAAEYRRENSQFGTAAVSADEMAANLTDTFARLLQRQKNLQSSDEVISADQLYVKAAGELTELARREFPGRSEAEILAITQRAFDEAAARVLPDTVKVRSEVRQSGDRIQGKFLPDADDVEIRGKSAAAIMRSLVRKRERKNEAVRANDTVTAQNEQAEIDGLVRAVLANITAEAKTNLPSAILMFRTLENLLNRALFIDQRNQVVAAKEKIFDARLSATSVTLARGKFTLLQIIDMLEGESNTIGIALYVTLDNSQKYVVKQFLTEGAKARLAAEEILSEEEETLIARIGGDAAQDLEKRSTVIRELEAKVFSVGEKVSAFGTNNSFDTLLRIILEGKIRASKNGPLTDGNGDPAIFAGVHGPYYVLVKDEAGWQNRKKFLGYLVPSGADKRAIVAVIERAAEREPKLFGAIAKDIRREVMTYAEFVASRSEVRTEDKTGKGSSVYGDKKNEALVRKFLTAASPSRQDYNAAVNALIQAVKSQKMTFAFFYKQIIKDFASADTERIGELISLVQKSLELYPDGREVQLVKVGRRANSALMPFPIEFYQGTMNTQISDKEELNPGLDGIIWLSANPKDSTVLGLAGYYADGTPKEGVTPGKILKRRYVLKDGQIDLGDVMPGNDLTAESALADATVQKIQARYSEENQWLMIVEHMNNPAIVYGINQARVEKGLPLIAGTEAEFKALSKSMGRTAASRVGVNAKGQKIEAPVTVTGIQGEKTAPLPQAAKTGKEVDLKLKASSDTIVALARAKTKASITPAQWSAAVNEVLKALAYENITKISPAILSQIQLKLGTGLREDVLSDLIGYTVTATRVLQDASERSIQIVKINPRGDLGPMPRFFYRKLSEKSADGVTQLYFNKPRAGEVETVEVLFKPLQIVESNIIARADIGPSNLQGGTVAYYNDENQTIFYFGGKNPSIPQAEFRVVRSETRANSGPPLEFTNLESVAYFYGLEGLQSENPLLWETMVRRHRTGIFMDRSGYEKKIADFFREIGGRDQVRKMFRESPDDLEAIFLRRFSDTDERDLGERVESLESEFSTLFKYLRGSVFGKSSIDWLYDQNERGAILTQARKIIGDFLAGNGYSGRKDLLEPEVKKQAEYELVRFFLSLLIERVSRNPETFRKASFKGAAYKIIYGVTITSRDSEKPNMSSDYSFDAEWLEHEKRGKPALLAAVLAHELGHNLQNGVGIPHELELIPDLEALAFTQVWGKELSSTWIDEFLQFVDIDNDCTIARDGVEETHSDARAQIAIFLEKVNRENARRKTAGIPLITVNWPMLLQRTYREFIAGLKTEKWADFFYEQTVSRGPRAVLTAVKLSSDDEGRLIQWLHTMTSTGLGQIYENLNLDASAFSEEAKKEVLALLEEFRSTNLGLGRVDNPFGYGKIVMFSDEQMQKFFELAISKFGLEGKVSLSASQKVTALSEEALTELARWRDSMTTEDYSAAFRSNPAGSLPAVLEPYRSVLESILKQFTAGAVPDISESAPFGGYEDQYFSSQKMKDEFLPLLQDKFPQLVTGPSSRSEARLQSAKPKEEDANEIKSLGERFLAAIKRIQVKDGYDSGKFASEVELYAEGVARSRYRLRGSDISLAKRLKATEEMRKGIPVLRELLRAEKANVEGIKSDTKFWPHLKQLESSIQSVAGTSGIFLNNISDDQRKVVDGLLKDFNALSNDEDAWEQSKKIAAEIAGLVEVDAARFNAVKEDLPLKNYGFVISEIDKEMNALNKALEGNQIGYLGMTYPHITALKRRLLALSRIKKSFENSIQSGKETKARMEQNRLFGERYEKQVQSTQILVSKKEQFEQLAQPVKLKIAVTVPKNEKLDNQDRANLNKALSQTADNVIGEYRAAGIEAVTIKIDGSLHPDWNQTKSRDYFVLLRLRDGTRVSLKMTYERDAKGIFIFKSAQPYSSFLQRVSTGLEKVNAKDKNASDLLFEIAGRRPSPASVMQTQKIRGPKSYAEKGVELFALSDKAAPEKKIYGAVVPENVWTAKSNQNAIAGYFSSATGTQLQSGYAKRIVQNGQVFYVVVFSGLQAKPRAPRSEVRAAKAGYRSEETLPVLTEGQVRYPSDEFMERGGWKLHLNVSKVNAQKVHEWLWKTGVGYKYGRSSGQNGKDFTIYVGSRRDANEIADRLASEIADLISPPTSDTLRDDIPLTETSGSVVVGRFDTNRQRVGERQVDFNQYGGNGVPFMDRDYNEIAGISVWGSEEEKESLPAKIQQATERANAILVKAFGDYFTGEGDTDSKVDSTTPTPDPKLSAEKTSDASSASLGGVKVSADSGTPSGERTSEHSSTPSIVPEAPPSSEKANVSAAGRSTEKVKVQVSVKTADTEDPISQIDMSLVNRALNPKGENLLASAGKGNVKSVAVRRVLARVFAGGPVMRTYYFTVTLQNGSTAQYYASYRQKSETEWELVNRSEVRFAGTYGDKLGLIGSPSAESFLNNPSREVLEASAAVYVSTVNQGTRSAGEKVQARLTQAVTLNDLLAVLESSELEKIAVNSYTEGVLSAEIVKDEVLGMVAVLRGIPYGFFDRAATLFEAGETDAQALADFNSGLSVLISGNLQKDQTLGFVFAENQDLDLTAQALQPFIEDGAIGRLVLMYPESLKNMKPRMFKISNFASVKTGENLADDIARVDQSEENRMGTPVSFMVNLLADLTKLSEQTTGKVISANTGAIGDKKLQLTVIQTAIYVSLLLRQLEEAERENLMKSPENFKSFLEKNGLAKVAGSILFGKKGVAVELAQFAAAFKAAATSA